MISVTRVLEYWRYESYIHFALTSHERHVGDVVVTQAHKLVAHLDAVLPHLPGDGLDAQRLP